MRRFILFGVALLLNVSALAQVRTTSYSLNSGDVGKNTYELKSTGEFESRTNLNIAGSKIESVLTGVIKGDHVVEFILQETSGSTSGKVVWKNGKALATQNGKEVAPEAPVKWAGVPIFAPFHPQLSSFFLKAYAKAKDKSKLQFLNPNAMALMEFPVALTTRTATVGGNPMPLQVLKVTVTGIGIDFVFSVQGFPLGMEVKVQKFSATLEGFNGIFEDPLAKYPELSQPTIAKVKRETLQASMRDGVKLATEVIRPDADGTYPVVLIRTPYGRAASAADGEFYAKRGYVLISQDVRGRGNSGGQWDPFNREVADGKDTLDWIVKQPWSDGKVGMIGGSYLGLVQWAAAVTHHPALKCIIPQVSPPDPTKNIPWDNGAFLLSGNVWWSRIVKDKDANMAAAQIGMAGVFNELKTLPLNRVDNAVFKVNIPFYDNWLTRDTLEKWPGAFRESQIPGVKIPIMHVSGVWDGDGIGTKLHWEAQRRSGGNQWLIFGPWEHGFNVKTKFADENYGAGSILELDSVYLRFFDTFLKDKEVNMAAQPRVRFFISGSNEWIESKDWPLPQSKRMTLYLAGGHALGKDSKGALAEKPGSGVDRYAYDPNKPRVRKADLEVDPAKASITIKKNEIPSGWAIYKSAPFVRNTVVTGPIEVKLSASTTGKDATFHAMLMEVMPDGALRMWQMPGTMRPTYATGKFVPLQPGKVISLTIRPWEAARQFKKGSRLALVITSDFFPQYARNPGTGEPDWKAKRLMATKHTIYKSAARPSSVSFQVLER